MKVIHLALGPPALTVLPVAGAVLCPLGLDQVGRSEGDNSVRGLFSDVDPKTESQMLADKLSSGEMPNDC